MRTITLTDDQEDKLVRILRKEFFAAYTTEKEKAAADELYLVVTNSRHEPDPDWIEDNTDTREPGLFRFAPAEAMGELR